MEILRAFRTFDEDGSGNIDAYELKMAMRALGMRVHDDDIMGIMEEAIIAATISDGCLRLTTGIAER